ncbi:hypothetical protein BGX34_000903, partial [Mortierella sp. NVP85]
ANRRPQAPVWPVTSTGSGPATSPASGSSAPPIRFGSFGGNDSAPPLAVTEVEPSASTTGTAMTFGSIPASQPIPAKPEETPAVSVPVVTPQEPAQPAVHASEHHNSFKPPHHISQPHMHGHPSHRRTDSTSNDQSHYRGQVPPAISQAPMIPSMGVPQAGGPYPSQRPKSHGMPMGAQVQHHGMHTQHMQQQQWAPQPYYPAFDPTFYQQQMYPQMTHYIPPQQRPMSRPYNPNAPAFTPPAPPAAKRILSIKNPETGEEVDVNKLAGTPAPSSTEAKAPKGPVVIDIKNPEEEKKPATRPKASSAVKIVKPEDREKEERERKDKEEKERLEREEKERLEREEKERLEKEAKEAEERRIREEQAEKERLEAEARAEKERLEAEARAEKERQEREERERKEKEERELREKEERERLEKEELERKEREERERQEFERKEKARKEQEEKERLEREHAEAERKRIEEEERIAREKAEAEKARLEKEKAEQEAKEKLEAERLAALEAEKAAEKAKQAEAAAESKSAASGSDSSKPSLSIDLSRTMSAPPSSLSARIENFNAVSYPSGIQSPSTTEGQGKFRYGRDFLMQFMNVCMDRPDSLPSLDVLGGDNDRNMSSPSNSQRGPRSSMSGGRKPNAPLGSMGSFNLGPNRLNGGMTRNPSSDIRMPHRTPSDNIMLPPRNNSGGLTKPPSGRGSRGGKRGGGGQGRGDRHQEPVQVAPLPDVAPLEKTENAWVFATNASHASSAISADEPLSQEQVNRKVKGLLNKLTLEKFDSISDKVVEIANLSAKEDDGSTLKLCIQIIFEKATDEPNFGSVYAKLCHKLHEKVSDEVKDKNIPGSTGGKLFRKYLLHRCQEDFTKGWKDKASIDGVSLNDKDGGPDLMSDEYYVMMKAKRQGLGLIHFIGELFKLQMLTEKIMHDCVRKLLANVKDPEEEEIEGLCKLMTTVGLQLDHEKAKNHMDVYFVRMVELTKNQRLPSRIRFMVQDVIDLRSNKWVNKRAAAGPKTIAAIHEEAARLQEEKEMMRRTASSGGGRGLPNRREQLGRGASYRGSNDARHDIGGVPPSGGDGWSTVPSPTVPKKAGDLSFFGNTSRSKTSGAPSLGPTSSVFGSLAKGKRADKVAPQGEAPRQISSSNSFAALEGDASDRRSSVENEKPMERKRLMLLPRSTPLSEQEGTSKSSDSAPAEPKRTEEEAKRSIETTLKEYLSLRDVDEMLASVKELDGCYRPMLVTEFVNQSMEMKQSDVDSIAEVFKKLLSEQILTPEDFEAGFSDPLEFLPDTAIDVPNAYKYAAQLLEAAGMDPAKAAEP